MRSRTLRMVAGLLAALAFLACFLVLRIGKSKINLADAPAFNVLLITLDTTRADRLGCYGYQPAQTPYIDGLAREGVRFARAYCPAPLTLPSHCSILSGLHPVTHGVRNNGHVLAPGIRTLAEILNGHGYSTSAFVSAFSVDSRFGIGRGFDVYDDTFQSQLPLKSANAERRAEETFARFSRWLEEHWQDRFFAWVHYYDPHLPYDPPPPFREEYGDRPYDGEIAYMDRYVGAVLERLRERGILERTVIVVAGDHGEGLGDKGESGHGIFLYEETLRVPLIFHNRKILPRPQVIESAVRLVDVAPTLLEMVGLNSEAAGMQGRSLVSWIRGKAGEWLDALAESLYPRENFGWSELVGLISGPWKFIQAPRPELYDLNKDPDEKTNLYARETDRAGEMVKKLELELLRLSSGLEVAGRPVADRLADRERLRSLGYVNLAPARPGSVSPDPKDKVGLLRLVGQAQALEFKEQYSEAEVVYREILAEIPDSPEAYVNLAIAKAKQNKFDEAVETLTRGIDRIADCEVLLVRLGHTYLVMGKPREALETMQNVLALSPQNIDALTVSAGILEATGRRDQARDLYQQALAVEPESRHLRISLAGNLASGGELRQAIGIYEGLIRDFPEEQAFYQFAGIAHSYLGEYDRAVSLLRQAVAIRPTPEGYFNLAVAHEKGGRLKEAVENFRLYLQNSQGESEANVRKARAELERLEKMLETPSSERR